MNDEFFDLELPNIIDRGERPPSGWRYLSRSGVVKCVFSTTKSMKMGVGPTSTTRESQNFWYIEQVGKDMFEGRMVNNRHVPTGNAETITMQDLISNYTPEIAYYEELVLPAMIEQGKASGKTGDQPQGVGEENVKALFGLALIYLARDEVDRARDLLADLVKMRISFEGKDQHLFNEFGIVLRKNNMYAEAVLFFERALEFVKNDEHLYYNLARAHYENGDWNSSLENLILSHRLNPGLGVVRNLFEVMVGLEKDKGLLGRYGKPPVPPEVAARARQVLAADTGKLTLDEEPVVLDIERGRARSGSPVGFVELKKHGSDE